MARTLKITDGSTSVNLINTGATGIIGSRGGLAHGRLRSNLQIVTSPLSDGGVLRGATRPLITEKYRLNLKGSSDDNAASQIQTLHELLLQAEKYHYTSWETSPVYIEAQTTNETSPRYSLVYGSSDMRLPDFYDLPFEVSNNLEEFQVSIVREPYWRSGAPGSLPTALTLTGRHSAYEANGIEQYIVNYYQHTSITHIYIDDGGVFSANKVADNNYDLLPSTPAVGDALYIGNNAGQLHAVVFDLSTLGSGYTGVWESYISGAWTGSIFCDGTNKLQGTDGDTGEYSVFLTDAYNQQSTTINSVAARWIRFRVTGITTPSAPHQSSTQRVFSGKENVLEIPSTALNGNSPAILRFRLRAKYDHEATEFAPRLGDFIAGAKSRGLTNFRSTLNMTGENPTGWSINYGTDTASDSSDRNSGVGSSAKCTFTTVQTMNERWNIELDDATKCEDWRGIYQAFLRCYQVGGSAGDVTVQLRVRIDGGSNWTKIYKYYDEVQLKQGPVAAGHEYSEVVNLGRVSIPSTIRGKSLVETPTIISINFGIQAKSDNGATPDLWMRDLTLIPIDEMVWRATIPDTKSGDEYLVFDPSDALIVDGGIIGEGAQCVTAGIEHPGSANHEMVLRSSPPRLEPDKTTRIYILFFNTYYTPLPSGSGIQSLGSYGIFGSIYAHECWQSLRGAD